MQGKWKEEFNEDYAVPEIISNNLTDVSWHNNTSPSFSDDGDETTLWCEHPDRNKREMQNNYRFYITNNDCEVLWRGDDASQALVQYGNILKKKSHIGEMTEAETETLNKLVEKYDFDGVLKTLVDIARADAHAAKPDSQMFEAHARLTKLAQKIRLFIVQNQPLFGFKKERT